MNKSLPFAILAAGGLLSATAGIAAAAPQATAPAHTQVAKQVTTKKTGSTATVTSHTTATTTRRAANGHMVTAKTSTGKTVTYDCSKAGNKTKVACKK